MKNQYGKIFSGEPIYWYPFTKIVDYFTILWWIHFNMLNEDVFLQLKEYLLNNNFKKIYIKIKNQTNECKLSNFSYEKYRKLVFDKWDYDIFWDQHNFWISISQEMFALIGWKKEFLKIFIGRKDFNDRLEQFSKEWGADVKWNWSYDLVRRTNMLKK